MGYANANANAVQRVVTFLVNEDNNAIAVFTVCTKHLSKVTNRDSLFTSTR